MREPDVQGTHDRALGELARVANDDDGSCVGAREARGPLACAGRLSAEPGGYCCRAAGPARASMPMDVPDRAPVPPILVAYDGSAAARTALSWATAEAVGSGRPLRLVDVMRWPLHELDKLRVPPSVHYAGQARQAATAMVGAAVAHCRQVAPGLDVHGDTLTGEATELLTELAADASLLVLGASGQTARPQVLLGFTAAELARRVTTPVAVIRDVAENDRGHGVVIGIDGSPAGDSAVREGFAVAGRRRLPVVAVQAWSDLPLRRRRNAARLVCHAVLHYAPCPVMIVG